MKAWFRARECILSDRMARWLGTGLLDPHQPQLVGKGKNQRTEWGGEAGEMDLTED